MYIVVCISTVVNDMYFASMSSISAATFVRSLRIAILI